MTFTVKPEGIVEVDANGVVTARAVGTATITAATHNGKKATCVVTVTEAPEEIRFSQSVYTVKEGEVLKLAPEMLPAGTYGTPAFELSYEDDEFELATIDENGSLKGQYSGSVTVKATVKNYNGGADATAICEVLVVPAPRTIELRETRTSIGVKEIMDLEPVAFDARGNEVEAAFTLKSSKTAYVQVNGTSVKGVKAGSASVTITADNGIKKSVKIKVVKAPAKVGISRASATISEMDTLRLAAAVPTGTQGKITWSSSHPEVATVDETGFVTAVAPGKTEIIAKAYNGKQASCALTVMNEPTRRCLRRVEDRADWRGREAQEEGGAAGGLLRQDHLQLVQSLRRDRERHDGRGDCQARRNHADCRDNDQPQDRRGVHRYV